MRLKISIEFSGLDVIAEAIIGNLFKGRNANWAVRYLIKLQCVALEGFLHYFLFRTTVLLIHICSREDGG